MQKAPEPKPPGNNYHSMILYVTIAHLLVVNGHERLAVNQGCPHLDSVVFTEIDLVYVDFLLLAGEYMPLLVLRNRRDDGAVTLFPRRPWGA